MLETNKLRVHGQGTIIYKPINRERPLTFTIKNKDSTNLVKFSHGQNINIQIYYSFKDNPIVKEYDIPLLKDENASYWFSIDSQNQIYMGGLGEARLETKYFKIGQFKDVLMQIENMGPISIDNVQEKNVKTGMESLIEICYLDNVKIKSIYRDPVVTNVPLIVKNTNDLTMDDVAENTFLPHSFLNPTCQQLYDCVSGKKFILNTPDFPDFAKAIEYSIATPGCWCNKKLKEKSTEFNPNVPNMDETYLRITLGKNSGESPGIPYVMEIWPSGHYSPIHSHANASAIIRVLHGGINVTLYPFLSNGKDEVKSFGEANFDKEDVTWLTPQLNQTHQLKNIRTESTCITIQCYMYDQNNKKHYDYFDYIDSDGNIMQYEPDSDMDFVNFKKVIKKEWKSRPKNCIFKFLPFN